MNHVSLFSRRISSKVLHGVNSFLILTALAAYGISSTPTPCVVFEATPPITGLALSSSATDPYRLKLFWSDESKIYHKEFTLPRHRASGCPDQGESKTMSIHCDVECKSVFIKF